MMKARSCINGRTSLPRIVRNDRRDGDVPVELQNLHTSLLLVFIYIIKLPYLTLHYPRLRGCAIQSTHYRLHLEQDTMCPFLEDQYRADAAPEVRFVYESSVYLETNLHTATT
jgi:hypothetical protein